MLSSGEERAGGRAWLVVAAFKLERGKECDALAGEMCEVSITGMRTE